MRFRRSMLIIILFTGLLMLQYRLWFKSGGIRDLYQLRKTIALQKNENEKLKRSNDELLFQITRLQKSQDAAESRARNELGMIKKGETFYQIVR